MNARVRGRAAVAASLLAAAVGVPFFAATTFVGDDHLFLAFARYASSPLVPFVRDQHGGEFYRPLPMALWWLLARVGGGAAVPFAALALGLHLGAAALLVVLVRAVGRCAPRAAALAGALFLVAPQNLEAAYWFAASTDLLATTFALGSLLALLRGRAGLAAGLAAAAYLSKESALILPALGVLVLSMRVDAPGWRRRLGAVAPQVALAVGFVAVRVRILRGWGGTGDARASLPAKLLQVVSGFVHVGTGADVLPDPLSWGLGTAALALLAVVAARHARAGERRVAGALAFAAVAAAPLLAAGWAVGARYYYLPAAGLAWAAGEALAGAGAAAQVTLVGALLGLGAVQASARRGDVVSYEARVAAARRAVRAGLAAGHRVFHVAGGVKDLDLVVKEDPRLERALVLCDVPASFAIIPADLEHGASILVARPPLPPSGAYAFGDQRIVGLARRGDDPALDEVRVRFPDIRFVRLRPGPAGLVIARDVTDELEAPGE
jgi:hypothetical protein